MRAALLTLALVAAPSPAGIELHQSECASGGFDWFFFESGTVIAKCWGCTSRPDVRVGRWRADGETIRVTMDRQWRGAGKGRIVEVASVNVYDHPETFQRVLDPAELGGRSPEELRLARNEIFARYGLKLRDPALRAHFAALKRHDGWMSDVDAFLSDVERENVKRLSAAERAARPAPAGP